MRCALPRQSGLSGAREWSLQCTPVPLLLLMEQSCRKWGLSCLSPMLSFHTHFRVFCVVPSPLSLTLKVVLEATPMYQTYPHPYPHPSSPIPEQSFMSRYPYGNSLILTSNLLLFFSFLQLVISSVRLNPIPFLLFHSIKEEKKLLKFQGKYLFFSKSLLITDFSGN